MRFAFAAASTRALWPCGASAAVASVESLNDVVVVGLIESYKDGFHFFSDLWNLRRVLRMPLWAKMQ